MLVMGIGVMEALWHTLLSFPFILVIILAALERKSTLEYTLTLLNEGSKSRPVLDIDDRQGIINY